MTVVVVGGGITGLTAAYALGRAGIPIVLLEAGERLGGKVRTEVADGFVIDHGPDSFVTHKPGVMRLAQALGLADEIIRPLEPRTVFIRTGGRLRRFPEGLGPVLPTRIRPFVTTDLFAPWDKLRMGLDLVLPRDDRTGDLSVGAFLRRRLGRALVDRVAGPLFGGVHGTPVDELSLDAVAPSLWKAEREHRSLLLAALAAGRARTAAAAVAGGVRGDAGGMGPQPAAPFLAMARGSGQLIDALVAATRNLTRVEVRTGAPVVRIDPDGAGVVTRLHGGELLRAEAAIIATPGPVAADLLAGSAPEAARAIRSIPHSTTTVVTLAYRADQVPDGVTGHGFLVADDEPLGIHALTLSSRKWAGRAPGGALLARAFVRPSRATRAESGASGDDAALIAVAHRDVAGTLGLRGVPALTRIARFPRLMPQYTVGHLDRVAAAEAGLAALPAIRLAGAAYRGAGMADCIAQGEAAAAETAELLSGITLAASRAS